MDWTLKFHFFSSLLAPCFLPHWLGMALTPYICTLLPLGKPLNNSFTDVCILVIHIEMICFMIQVSCLADFHFSSHSCWPALSFMVGEQDVCSSTTVRRWTLPSVTLHRPCITWPQTTNWTPAATTPCPCPTGQRWVAPCSCLRSPQRPKSEWSSPGFSVASQPSATWLCCGQHTVTGSANPTSGC